MPVGFHTPFIVTRGVGPDAREDEADPGLPQRDQELVVLAVAGGGDVVTVDASMQVLHRAREPEVVLRVPIRAIEVQEIRGHHASSFTSS